MVECEFCTSDNLIAIHTMAWTVYKLACMAESGVDFVLSKCETKSVLTLDLF